MRKTKHDIKYDAALEAVGWAYADCCADLDNGTDPRKADMDDVVKRAENDLNLKKAVV